MSENTLAELFASDPMGLTDQDVERVIQAFRENRDKFLNPTSAKPQKAPKPEGKLKLGDFFDD